MQKQLIHLNGSSQNSFRSTSQVEVFVSSCLLVLHGGIEVKDERVSKDPYLHSNF